MHTRRTFLQRATYAAVCAWFSSGLLPRMAHAAEARPAFEATAVADALKALGAEGAKESTDITFKAPDIAENGAVVPLEIESRIANTRSIAILVEKNPHVMTAQFNFPDGTEPYVSTRVKVAESSVLHAVVKTDAGAFYITRLVKVTLGGCGG
ncbi:MAG: thiosulfate oxidation carrier protein SoxY [Proteobacteria bacterium]|jgi:sulfur-oxidizing protein SoxY|nr:thiosulfate oxidation carrier protein SoxY [Pseudomonadota bacterium]MBK8959249.1 thiosulfate oxidation carrier protein SoxY [Pseudomonadota bacterium]